MSIMNDVFAKHKEGILYIIFGGFTVLVSWGTYALFVLLGIDVNISNILSWICAVTFAFVVNKWFVFMSRSVDRAVLVKEVGSFFLLRIVTGVIAIILFPILLAVGLDQSLFDIDGLIARITVSMVEIALNYAASKFIVFRKKENNA
ncbi:MAG: GtrA family protein [Methanomassiliicoccaceae archaeon]|nr:GtrA family protein [Methanomassiliicoccaceae archaeon]